MNDLQCILKDTRKHLMSGVSYMIPFVVGGGIILALAVVLYGQGGVPDKETHKFLNEMFLIGAKGFELMVPILAGYIAFSIADRPGIAPGAVAGLVGNQMGAGFLGGIAAGFIAGIVVFYLKKIKLPKALSSLMTIFIIPIVGIFITAGLMQWVIGTPIASITKALTEFLNSLSGGSIILLAIIIGMMDAFDMGGPVGKVAYTFALMSVSNGNFNIPAINAVGCSVPPLAVGLATFIGAKKFTVAEKEAGKAGFLMGLISISEGAIPFAAADPLRIIPANMIGGAVGCAIAAMFNVTNKVAWGGIIVLPAITNVAGYLIALAAGTIVAAGLIVAFKRPVSENDSNSLQDEDIELELEIG